MKQKRDPAQTSFTEECILDSFAGGGCYSGVGNAVCPPMAEAVVRANLPEWCGGKIETMDQLKRIVSA